MLPDTITLDTDHATIGAATDSVYERYTNLPNRSDYIKSDHTTQARRMFQVYRTFPKRSGLSLGVAKVAIKFTSDQEVLDSAGNTTLAPLIGEISFALPVGVTDAMLLSLSQKMACCLVDGLNDADFVASTLKTLEI